MTKKEAAKRIERLRVEIERHRYNYHVLDRESISPAALDSLKNELFVLENSWPDLITPDSPTQRVAGKPLKKFKKVTHLRPMISLFDAFSEEDMLSWEERNFNYLKTNQSNLAQRVLKPDKTSAGARGGFQPEYYLELKLDGLAVSVRYENGIFKRGATRGDGLVGEDVSVNLKTISSLPLRLRRPSMAELKNVGLGVKESQEFLRFLDDGLIEVRGEAIMKKSVLAALNKKYAAEGKPLLANTRNAVAGSLRQLDPKISAERELDFYAYDLILDGRERGEIISRRNQADRLAALLGFKTLKENRVCSDLKEVFSVYREMEKKRSSLAFEIDGLVVKINDLGLWPVLGVVGKAPRYMMAYKFSAEQATTRVLEVVWQVGRTGILTPAARLEPVKVGGALISRSTLHNFSEIKRLGLRSGDTVVIERSGDVIPKVIKVLKNLRSGKEKPISPPRFCPICQGPVKRIGEEVAYRCLSRRCWAVNLRKIIHFVSKGAADFEGLGPKLIEQFMTAGLIKDAADLYSLKRSDLLGLERFAEKKADNVLAIISERQRLSVERFIYGLGIRQVGEETAALLADNFYNYYIRGKSGNTLHKAELKNIEISPQDLIKYFQNISKEELETWADVGPVVAESILNFWRDKENLELLAKFNALGLRLTFSSSMLVVTSDSFLGARTSALSGKIFVLTGSLSSLTREEAKVKIKVAGGKVKSALSKEVDYLVVGSEPGSKYERAKDLGTKILNEQEFLKMIA